ncbi:MAG: hypothetical protein J3K34DRAFT_365587 [Monoraphidium minutum]|nr:MAG: hypothetical protein J3K34DRAFT_365587 [Monoraphidium minutum]
MRAAAARRPFSSDRTSSSSHARAQRCSAAASVEPHRAAYAHAAWLCGRRFPRPAPHERVCAPHPAAAAAAARPQEMYESRPPADISGEYLWRERLEPLLWYLRDDERAMVHEGLELAVRAHSGQMRKSGEPFVTHPVEVTRILAEMRMDAESLVAGLLHDTVEDTDAVCFDDIERRFGVAVRRIVEGETKISKITKVNASGDDYSDDKARDLQGLFLAMTEDVRIILVKLADRLHNMRTLYGMTAAKQVKISQETLQVFAPLAKLLGVYCIKEELEDLALRYTQPEVYKHIKNWQDKQVATYQRAFSTGRADLEALLASDGYLQSHARGVEVRVRRKPAYSVGKALQAMQAARLREEAAALQETPEVGLLTHLKDLPDQGVYLQSHQLCYYVLGLVHSIWSPIPGGLEDFIGSPKTNGYQSLHTRVVPLSILSKNCPLLPMEVQIRTADMDRLADLGVAATNWGPAPPALPLSPPPLGLDGLNGSGGSAAAARRAAAAAKAAAAAPSSFLPSALRRQEAVADGNWLTQMRKWQEEFVGSLSAREFVDGVTAEVLGQSVFVYTHTGELRRLPKGSTVVDFAYSVHTQLGNEMRAALVNGRLVAPSYVLSNGEVVEVRREASPAVTPSMVRRHEQWVGFVRTRTAKLKIKAFLKEHARRQRRPCGPGGRGSGGGSGSDSSCDEEEDEACEVEGGDATLSISCADKMGLLAAVCNAITDSGHNIKVRRGGRLGVGSPCFAGGARRRGRCRAGGAVAAGEGCGLGRLMVAEAGVGG